MKRINQLISKQFANVLYNYTIVSDGFSDEDTVLGSKYEYYNPLMNLLLSELKPDIEEIYGKKLHETYALYRVYSQGMELKKHTDRPACEVSVSIFLGCNFNWQWPIFVDGVPYGLSQGEGILYKGCEEMHWREPLVYVPKLGEEQREVSLTHSQLFLHYIEAGGQYDPEHIWDMAKRNEAME